MSSNCHVAGLQHLIQRACTGCAPCRSRACSRVKQARLGRFTFLEHLETLGATSCANTRAALRGFVEFASVFCSVHSLALNYRKTRNMSRYMSRLTALIKQHLAISPPAPNFNVEISTGAAEELKNNTVATTLKLGRGGRN